MKYVLSIFVLVFSDRLVYSAARGSGTQTTGSVQFYKPVSREEPGYMTDSSSSYNNNWDIAASSLTTLIIGNATTYIRLVSALQAGATFYVASGSVNGTFTTYGNIFTASGSATSPGFSFLGDPDTGIFLQSPNILSFTTNGVEKIRIQDGGELRISTVGTSNSPSFSFINDNNNGIFSPGPDILAFTTNGTTSTLIDALGRVGISTNAPAYTFAVVGNAIVTSSLTIGGNIIAFNRVGISTNVPAYTFAEVGDAIVTSSLTVGGTLFTSSANIVNFGNLPAGPPSCPSGWTRVGINECIPTNGQDELVISSGPLNTTNYVFFTTSTVSLQNAAAKAADIKVLVNYINNSGSSSGVDLYIGLVGQSVANDGTRVCSVDTGPNNQEGDCADTRTIILNASQQFEYQCALRNSSGSSRACVLRVNKIYQ